MHKGLKDVLLEPTLHIWCGAPTLGEHTPDFKSHKKKNQGSLYKMAKSYSEHTRLGPSD